MSKMNKNDLIKIVANETNTSMSISKLIINSFCNNIENNILEGNSVSIKGLVHFYEKEHSEKETHNFKTGERKKTGKRTLPASRVSRSIIDQYKIN